MDLSADFAALAEGDTGPASKSKKQEHDVAQANIFEASQLKKPVLVMAGSTDWSLVVKGASGKIRKKSGGENEPEFYTPVIIGGPLLNVKITSISVGPCSGHCLLLSDKAQVWAWGLNTNGQLGLGNSCPAVVVRSPKLAKEWRNDDAVPIKAAVGKNHSLVLFDNGIVLSAGCGTRGALGRGSRKLDQPEIEKNPRQVTGPAGENGTDIAAGCDFSLIVTSSGNIYSFGWSEFGKLGTGSDGQYNTKASSIKLTYTVEGEPLQIQIPGAKSPGAQKLDDFFIVTCSAGKNHAACIAKNGIGYTWGDGAYGKLGHRNQEQCNAPTRLDAARFTVLLCSDSSTAGLGYPEYRGRSFARPSGMPDTPNDGILYLWGVLKGTHGEGATYPRPENELQGWQIAKSNFALGASHLALNAENSSISFAQLGVAFGQLGYGEHGPKSSHKPQKLHDLEDAGICAQVTAHAGATFFLYEGHNKNAVLEKLQVWTPPTEDDLTIDEQVADTKKSSAKPSKKRGASSSEAKSTKKKK
mmetsp:Transcript_9478/g.13113  ORF Transcript_9478/g.13113 Transcript_9478/m.13113 type:complete len:527 (+) Transcript_9478:77-1657(+)